MGAEHKVPSAMLRETACQLGCSRGNIITSTERFAFYLMTVRSRHSSLPIKRASYNATVVELRASRPSTSKNRVAGHVGASVANRTPSIGADLLSIRQHLSFKATMGITDLSFIEQSYSSQVADGLMGNVRDLLDQEFGHLRVHRQRQLFVVSHHCKESLVAGLLRVQFHSRQIPLPLTRDGKGMSDVCGVPLTWGVGESLGEAERERLKKKQNPD